VPAPGRSARITYSRQNDPAATGRTAGVNLVWAAQGRRPCVSAATGRPPGVTMAAMAYPTSGSGPDYALGRSAAETRRLIAQHQIYGPITRRFLTAAGVSAGMRVLDLGSGAGDVALLLADLVGPQGRVVGVDATRRS
jgi:2-polyprenyl-3-methyl-5-hydroxy-6-metoxy-1,4-benzoquinol methylase